MQGAEGRAPAEPFLSRSALAHYNSWRGPWGPESAPNHISKMVLSTVKIGSPIFTVDRTEPSRGISSAFPPGMRPWETQFSRALARLQAIPFPA